MRISFALARMVGFAALTAAIGGISDTAAQSVHFNARMGDKGLLVIDGVPATLSVGSATRGVRLLSINASNATVEWANAPGRRVVLPLGGTPVDLGGARTPGSGSQIVLSAGPGGHFHAGGSINGRPVRFLVDTGATLVSIGQADAQRLGLTYPPGAALLVNTANGPAAARRTTLDVVRIGDVQVYNVAALVMQAPMETVLLGNSFLSRFQMQRDSQTMRLDLQP